MPVEGGLQAGGRGGGVGVPVERQDLVPDVVLDACQRPAGRHIVAVDQPPLLPERRVEGLPGPDHVLRDLSRQRGELCIDALSRDLAQGRRALDVDGRDVVPPLRWHSPAWLLRHSVPHPAGDLSHRPHRPSRHHDHQLSIPARWDPESQLALARLAEG